MQRITPFLWFDSEAEEAANFYVGIFRNAKINAVSHYGDAGPGPTGTVMTVNFELDGQAFTALNGGPLFQFTEAISFVVSCQTQQELDTLWAALAEGGQEVRCGWLKDKYGLSWQIVPSRLGELMNSADPAQSQRVMQALLGMVKLDIEALERAAAVPGP